MQAYTWPTFTEHTLRRKLSLWSLFMWACHNCSPWNPHWVPHGGKRASDIGMLSLTVPCTPTLLYYYIIFISLCLSPSVFLPLTVLSPGRSKSLSRLFSSHCDTKITKTLFLISSPECSIQDSLYDTAIIRLYLYVFLAFPLLFPSLPLSTKLPRRASRKLGLYFPSNHCDKEIHITPEFHYFFYLALSPMQKTHQSALQVQQKAEALLQANHYDMDMIRDCAEKVWLSYNFTHQWRKKVL